MDNSADRYIVLPLSKRFASSLKISIVFHCREEKNWFEIESLFVRQSLQKSYFVSGERHCAALVRYGAVHQPNKKLLCRFIYIGKKNEKVTALCRINSNKYIFPAKYIGTICLYTRQRSINRMHCRRNGITPKEDFLSSNEFNCKWELNEMLHKCKKMPSWRREIVNNFVLSHRKYNINGNRLFGSCKLKKVDSTYEQLNRFFGEWNPMPDTMSKRNLAEAKSIFFAFSSNGLRLLYRFQLYWGISFQYFIWFILYGMGCYWS